MHRCLPQLLESGRPTASRALPGLDAHHFQSRFISPWVPHAMHAECTPHGKRVTTSGGRVSTSRAARLASGPAHATHALHRVRARTAAFHAHAPVQNRAGIVGPVWPRVAQQFAAAHADFSLLLHRDAAAEGCPACALTAQGVPGLGEVG